MPDTATRARVLLADDHELMRRTLGLAIRAHDSLELVGEAEDGAGAVELALTLRPDAVVLDLTMPRLDGFEAAAELRARLPHCAILVFSSMDDEDIPPRALAAGADRFLAKAAGVGAAADAVAELVRRCAARPR